MKSHVYLLRAGPYLKIGKANDLQARIRQLQTSCPEPIEVVSTKDICCSHHAREVESALHDAARGWRTSGEWFQGGAWVESLFSTMAADRVSLCPDIDRVADCIALFYGVAPQFDGFDKRDWSAKNYPVAGGWASLLPASNAEHGAMLGYVLSDVDPDTHDLIPGGWYVISGGWLRVVLYSGEWSETKLSRFDKAERDAAAVLRNFPSAYTYGDTPLLLPAPARRGVRS